MLKGDPETARRGKRRAFSLRNVLVVAQVALSLVVLVCGGLFIKSFRKAQTMDPGFNNAKGLIMSLSPTLLGYEERAVATVLPSGGGARVACARC